MKTFDVPGWIIAPFTARGVSENDYFLYGAGRALGFVRMAADALSSLSDDLKIAEYHAYAGISAARTIIDATAAWLNAILNLDVSPPHNINLSRIVFRSSLLDALPGTEAYVKRLGNLGCAIDEHRQRAQHREGLALIPHSTGGWYLAPDGLSGDRAKDLHIANALKCWADEIEDNVREIHRAVTTSPN